MKLMKDNLEIQNENGNFPSLYMGMSSLRPLIYNYYGIDLKYQTYQASRFFQGVGKQLKFQIWNVN